jgi:hypothetical protein
MREFVEPESMYKKSFLQLELNDGRDASGQSPPGQSPPDMVSFRLTNYRAEEHQNFQGVTHLAPYLSSREGSLL